MPNGSGLVPEIGHDENDSVGAADGESERGGTQAAGLLVGDVLKPRGHAQTKPVGPGAADPGGRARGDPPRALCPEQKPPEGLLPGREAAAFDRRVSAGLSHRPVARS